MMRRRVQSAVDVVAGMPLSTSQLESKLWNAAEILRGSAVDRTDWQAYILPLLFFKRISDTLTYGPNKQAN